MQTFRAPVFVPLRVFLALLTVFPAYVLLPMSAEAQQALDAVVFVSNPSITITTGTADTQPARTVGVHEAVVQWKFGTVVGSFTTCTVQPKTSIDGVNYLTLGSAISVTVTTGTVNAWRITEPSSGAVSATVAAAFGQLTKYTFACSGAYGTSAPVTINATYFPTAVGGGGGAGSTVEGTGTAGTPAGGLLTVQGATSMTPIIIQGLVSGVAVPVTFTGSAAVPTGTAGSPSSSVVTIQGITSGIPMPVTTPTSQPLAVTAQSGSTTAVTQTTATNLKAQVVGAGTAGTADANPITIQGIASGVPVPVTTPANQPLKITGNGTAGSADTGVQTVQGIASGTPLIIQGIASGTPVPVTINGIKYNATPATLADQATGDLQIDATQNLKVTGSGTAGTPSAGILTVQFANSALPFTTIVCPTNATRAFGYATVTTTTTANVAWFVNDSTTVTRTAAGAGLKYYVYSAQITNSGATNATVDLQQDGAAGVPLVTLASKWVAPTNTTPFGGSNMTFPSAIFQPTTNRALSIAASANSTSITVNLQGCVGP